MPKSVDTARMTSELIDDVQILSPSPVAVQGLDGLAKSPPA